MKERNNNFPARVAETIDEYNMVVPGDRVMVALSGGPDSTALLYALLELSAGAGFEIGIFHMDHGLRAEAASEAEEIAGIGGRLDLPTFIVKDDVKAFCDRHSLGIQEGARSLRYRNLRRTALENGFTKEAFGHTADDSIETFLMRLIRGAGPAGLASIPPVRGGRIVRPLINTSREEILGWLEEKGIGYFEDPSNKNTKYFRNKIRSELVPLLTGYNPRFRERVAVTIKLIRDEETLVAECAAGIFEELAVRDGGEISLDAAGLKNLGPAMGRTVIRRAVAEAAPAVKDFDFDHYNAVWRGLILGSETAVDLPYGVRAVRDGVRVIVYRPIATIPAAVIGPGETVDFSGKNINVAVKDRGDIGALEDSDMIYADAGRIIWPMTVRSAKPGDSFRPLGLGGTKKVHDFLIDEKIPRRRRPGVPVYLDKEKIIAVGQRVDERVKVTDKTKEVAAINTGSGDSLRD